MPYLQPGACLGRPKLVSESELPLRQFWAVSDKWSRVFGAFCSYDVLYFGFRLILWFRVKIRGSFCPYDLDRLADPTRPRLASPQIHPKCCSDPDIHLGWPYARESISLKSSGGWHLTQEMRVGKCVGGCLTPVCTNPEWLKALV